MSKKFDALEAKKELLMMKAELERMEFGGQVDVLKKEFAWVSAFKRFGNWVAQRNVRALGPIASFGGQFWQDGLKKYPMLGMVASTLLLRYSRPLSKVALRAGLGAVVLAAGMFWYKKGSQLGSLSSNHNTTNQDDS